MTMTPFLVDMPPLFSTRPLPDDLAEARAEWAAAVHTARADLLEAARAFLRVAELLKRSGAEATEDIVEIITSMRLLALENALEAGAVAGERDRMERELLRLSWSEPALNEGIGRLLRGDLESQPPAEPPAEMEPAAKA